MSTNLTRRRFIEVAATAGSGLALATLIGCSSQGAAPAASNAGNATSKAGLNVAENPITDANRIKAKTAPTIVFHVGFDNIEGDAYFTMLPYRTTSDAFLVPFGYQQSTEFNGLMDQYVTLSDKTQKTDLAKRAMGLVKDYMPMVWMYHPVRVYAVAGNVDFRPRGDGQMHLQDIKAK